MATYSAEPIVPEILQSMLQDNWQNYGGKVPLPQVVSVNVDEEDQYKYNFQGKDHVFVQVDPIGEQATARDTYRYWDIDFNTTIHLYTMSSRQRLYDLKSEIRRITIYKMHDTTTNGYQLVRYKGFTELPSTQKVWRGIIRVAFESNRVYYAIEA